MCKCGEQSLSRNEPRQGLRAGLFKGCSVADYWRQMAVRGQRLSLGNTQSQPCSGWRDTDTLRFYVFAFEGFSVTLALVCMWERRGDCVAGGEGGRARGWATATWFVEAEFKFSSPDLQVWSVPQPVRQPGQTWTVLHGSFHPAHSHLGMSIINKNNYSDYGRHVDR